MRTTDIKVKLSGSQLLDVVNRRADDGESETEELAYAVFRRCDHVDKVSVLENLITKVINDHALPDDYFNR